MYFIWLLVIVSSVLTTSCREQHLTQAEFIKFIENPENGYSQEVVDNGVYLRVQHIPVELIFFQDLPKSNLEFDSARDSLIKNYARFKYFKVTISRNEKSVEENFAGSEKYGEVINYLNNRIGNDFMLEMKSEVFHSFEAMYTPFYGSSSSTHILVVFKGAAASPGLQAKFSFNETIFNTGRKIFAFSIKKNPTLVL